MPALTVARGSVSVNFGGITPMDAEYPLQHFYNSKYASKGYRPMIERLEQSKKDDTVVSIAKKMTRELPELMKNGMPKNATTITTTQSSIQSFLNEHPYIGKALLYNPFEYQMIELMNTLNQAPASIVQQIKKNIQQHQMLSLLCHELVSTTLKKNKIDDTQLEQQLDVRLLYLLDDPLTRSQQESRMKMNYLLSKKKKKIVRSKKRYQRFRKQRMKRESLHLFNNSTIDFGLSTLGDEHVLASFSETKETKDTTSKTKMKKTTATPTFGAIGFNNSSSSSSSGTTPYQQKITKKIAAKERQEEEARERRNVRYRYTLLKCLSIYFKHDLIKTRNVNANTNTNVNKKNTNMTMPNYDDILMTSSFTTVLVQIIRMKLLTATNGQEIESNPSEFSTMMSILLSLSNSDSILRGLNERDENKRSSAHNNKSVHILLNDLLHRLNGIIKIIRLVQMKEEKKNQKSSSNKLSSSKKEQTKELKEESEEKEVPYDDENISLQTLLARTIQASLQQKSSFHRAAAAAGQQRTMSTTVCICHKGHNIVVDARSVDARRSHYCNMCQEKYGHNTRTYGTAYRCPQPSCDYDVCQQCWNEERTTLLLSSDMSDTSDTLNTSGNMMYPPFCGKKGHKRMVHTTYAGKMAQSTTHSYKNGYVCDLCKGQSSKNHHHGSMNRWWCELCSYDICFECVPEFIDARCQQIIQKKKKKKEKKKQKQMTLLQCMLTLRSSVQYILIHSDAWKRKERERVKLLVQQQQQHHHQQHLSFHSSLRTFSEVERTEELSMSIFDLYEKRMKKHRFQYRDILHSKVQLNSPKYKYHAEATAASNTTTAAHSSSHDTALLTELTGVLMEPPLSFNSCTLIRVDENNPSVLQFVVLAGNSGAGSPYDGGCFQFDLYCPSTYPEGPPKCHLMTTGSGAVRFNPNLYDSGYVCLTVLNAKGSGGQTWRKNESNILEVILAIEYFCLNAMYPLFNEPSEESSFKGMDTDSTTKKRVRTAHWSGSQFGQTGYQPVREGTIQYAMIQMLRSPPKGFEDAIREHFLLKGNYIVRQIRGWINDSERFSDTVKHRENLHYLLSEFIMELWRFDPVYDDEKEEEEKEKEGETKEVTKEATTTARKKELLKEQFNMENSKYTVLISNFNAKDKDKNKNKEAIHKTFAKCGTISSIKTAPGNVLYEIKFENKKSYEACLKMNGTVVETCKIVVRKKVDMKPFTFENESCEIIGPVPEQAGKEEYDYQMYPF
jgi:ubiquitin-protein ligase